MKDQLSNYILDILNILLDNFHRNINYSLIVHSSLAFQCIRQLFPDKLDCVKTSDGMLPILHLSQSYTFQPPAQRLFYSWAASRL